MDLAPQTVLAKFDAARLRKRRRVGARQEEEGAGDSVGLTKAAERNVIRQAPEALF